MRSSLIKFILLEQSGNRVGVVCMSLSDQLVLPLGELP